MCRMVRPNALTLLCLLASPTPFPTQRATQNTSAVTPQNSHLLANCVQQLLGAGGRVGWEEASESSLSLLSLATAQPQKVLIPAAVQPPSQASVPPRLSSGKAAVPQEGGKNKHRPTGLWGVTAPSVASVSPLPHEAAKVSSNSQRLSDSEYHEV